MGPLGPFLYFCNVFFWLYSVTDDQNFLILGQVVVLTKQLRQLRAFVVIVGVDSIFGSENVISESSELSSFSISAKTKKRCFWMLSQSTVLGTTSYLVKMPEGGYICVD